MSVQQHSLPLILEKDFFLWVHKHKVILDPKFTTDNLANELKSVDPGTNKPVEILTGNTLPEQIEHLFGGCYEGQFNKEELQDLYLAFNKLLITKSIPVEPHRDHLLYTMLFYYEKIDALSNSFREQNSLKELARTFINLIELDVDLDDHNLVSEEQRIVYQPPVNSTYGISTNMLDALDSKGIDITKEGFDIHFNDEVMKSISKKDREQLPNALFKGTRVYIGQRYEKLFPEDIAIKINSLGKDFIIPNEYKGELLTLIMNFIWEKQKAGNTTLYQQLLDGTINEQSSRDAISDQRQVQPQSVNEALAPLIIVISDYIDRYKLLYTWPEKSKFILNCLALLGLVPPKRSRNLAPLKVRPSLAIEYCRKELKRTPDYISKILHDSTLENQEYLKNQRQRSRR